MQRRLIGLMVMALLSGCHTHHQASTASTPAVASDVQAGSSSDSVDPDLNALQRTKRKIDAIKAIRAKNVAQVNGAETQ